MTIKDEKSQQVEDVKKYLEDQVVGECIKKDAGYGHVPVKFEGRSATH